MIPVTIDRTWFYFFDQLFNCYKFLTVCCLYVNLVPVYNFFWTAAVQRLIWVLLFPSPEPCVSVFGKKMKKKVRFSQVQRPNLIAFLSQVRPPPKKKNPTHATEVSCCRSDCLPALLLPRLVSGFTILSDSDSSHLSDSDFRDGFLSPFLIITYLCTFEAKFFVDVPVTMSFLNYFENWLVLCWTRPRLELESFSSLLDWWNMSPLPLKSFFKADWQLQ